MTGSTLYAMSVLGGLLGLWVARWMVHHLPPLDRIEFLPDSLSGWLPSWDLTGLLPWSDALSGLPPLSMVALCVLVGALVPFFGYGLRTIQRLRAAEQAAQIREQAFGEDPSPPPRAAQGNSYSRGGRARAKGAAVGQKVRR